MHTLFIMIQYIGIIILIMEVFYVLGRKPSRQQQYLLFLILSLCISFVGYLLELEAKTRDEALMAVKFFYLGNPYIVLSQFLFVMQTCKIMVPKHLERMMIGLHTTVVFFVLSCDKHTLFYRSIGFEEEGWFPHLVLEYGIVHRLYRTIVFVYVTVMTGVCIYCYIKAKKDMEKRQFGCLILINLSATTGY